VAESTRVQLYCCRLRELSQWIDSAVVPLDQFSHCRSPAFLAFSLVRKIPGARKTQDAIHVVYVVGTEGELDGLVISGSIDVQGLDAIDLLRFQKPPSCLITATRENYPGWFRYAAGGRLEESQSPLALRSQVFPGPWVNVRVNPRQFLDVLTRGFPCDFMGQGIQRIVDVAVRILGQPFGHCLWRLQTDGLDGLFIKRYRSQGPEGLTQSL